MHGGQPAAHPRRHVMSIDAAVEIVRQFLCDGRIADLSGWERQAP